ncbi:hypothetical protein RJ55_05644 [Drechmeria coniospora]|nr:hypothetical protein RJ55_05644 [Drechmeria coniospora]
MDSPFNQGRGNGQSSTPPQKPVGGSNYQVNVNRTKTKKWVEAKVQNYDGDDWGADEYDDDAAEPASPVTQRTPATQPTSTQQTSTQQTSTQQTLTQPTSTQPTSTQPASTQSPSTQTPSRQSPVTQSPVMHSSGNPPGAAATSLPSAPNPLDVARAPYAATGVPSSPANQSQPIADPPSSSSPPVRERTVSPPPAAAATATNAVAAAALPDELVQKTSEQPPSSVRPSNVRTRANEEDTLDQRSPRPGPNDGDQTSSRSDSLWRDGSLSPNPESGVGARPANPLPKLPSVVRMSTFAPNLFLSTGGAFFSDPGMTSSDGRGSASPSLRDGSTPPPLPRTITPTSTTVEREPMPAMKGVLLPAQEKPAMSREPIVSHELSVTKAVPLATIDSYTAVKSTAKARNDEAAEAKRKTEARDPLPAHPAALVSETPERATPKPEAAASERTRKPPALSPQMGLDAVEPLRTQSPRGQTKLLDESRGSDAARAADQTPVEVEKETTPESVHLAPTYGSVASSPVKDSDILSDEILRSLSPGGKDAADPSFGQTVDHIQHAPSASTRDSRYTLKDYDSYWALTAAKPDPVGEESDSETAPPAPLAPDGKALPSNPPASSSATPAGSAEGTLLSEEEARIRRRFSWEAASRGVSPAPPGAPTASHEASETSQGAPTASREAPNAPHESPTASRGPTPASHEPPPATPAKSPPVSDGDADHGLRNRDAGVSESQPSVVGSVAASAAVSAVAATAAASAVASSHRPNSTLEPSPPVSALSDRQLLENKRLPSPKERTLTTQTPPRMVSPSPPLDSRLPRDPPTSQAAASQAVPFREIMGLPTSPERTAMFNASRDHYAVTDSGLDDWLDSIKDQHPEYTHGPVPFRAATSGQLGAAAGNMAPDALANTTTQQPYYQQYGASSTSSVTSPPSSRPRPGGPQTSQQASGGSLGHSGNQIGSKSKEFMQSAGKMGKGLLSKGRSKLRGSGDKEKPKVKNERRKSWGLGLGTRSASDEVTSPPRSHIAIQNDLANAAQVPPPTAVTASAPLHPSTPQRQGQHWAPTSGQAIQTDREQTPPFQGPPPSTPVGRAVAGLSRLEIPPGRPSVQSDGVGIGIEHPGGADDGRKQPQGEATREHGLDEWVTVPQQSNNQGPAANMLPSVSTTQREASVPAFEHSGVSVPSQPPVDDNEPKRDSSFIGLPPIRRSSTFALTSK